MTRPSGTRHSTKTDPTTHTPRRRLHVNYYIIGLYISPRAHFTGPRLDTVYSSSGDLRPASTDVRELEFLIPDKFKDKREKNQKQCHIRGCEPSPSLDC